MGEIDTGGHAEMWEDDERFLRRSDMTLRDWFAGKALAGDMAAQSELLGEWGNRANDLALVDRANLFCRFADAMIKVRRK